VTDVAAVNASPLIYLTGAGQLDLLRLAGDEVVVPRAVADEVGRWGADDPVARALDETPWLKVVPNPTVPPSIQAWDLGAGETAVLSHALSGRATAILDDRAGRRCALAHRIPVRGTLGLASWRRSTERSPRRGHCSSACENRACTSPTPCSIEPWR